MAAGFFTDDIAAAPSGVRNMAVDHALLEHVQRTHAPVLRLYAWRPACLSFGRNQAARAFYSADAAHAAGLDTVRRPTGGLAVLHDRELTYAVCLPANRLGGPRATYVAVNRALVAALRRLGAPATLSPGGPRAAFGAVQPCFAEPAPGEVTAAGAKLVGSAQRCERRTILQHGSILLEDSQAGIARVATVPIDVSGRATSLAALLGRMPDEAELVAAIRAGFEEVCGIPLAPARLPAAVDARATDLERHYASAAWTWRR